MSNLPFIMSDTEQDEYMKQLEEQRKAFEAQFGSLESLGFEDKTKHVQHARSNSNSSSDENSNSESDISNSELKNNESEDSADGTNTEDNNEDIEEENKLNCIIPIKAADNNQEKNIKKPKIIKFSDPSDTYIAPSKQEQKLLRSGRTLADNARKIAKLQQLRTSKHITLDDEDNEEEANIEAENLHNDIALQQFLKESHLLSAFSGDDKTNSDFSGVSLTLEAIGNENDRIQNNSNQLLFQDSEIIGKARMKTLEQRLHNLSKINGHNKKINKLEKVPMAIRKGMINKHLERITKYEQEAKEGGIVLSKVKKGQFRKIEATYKKDIERRIGTSIKSKDMERTSKRKRGLKINTIGRSTRNGLVVSKADIARINGINDINRKSKKSKSFKRHGARR